MLEWILVLLLAAVVLTNLAERPAVPYPSLFAIAVAGLIRITSAAVALPDLMDGGVGFRPAPISPMRPPRSVNQFGQAQ
jgi:hypothetical protein